MRGYLQMYRGSVDIYTLIAICTEKFAVKHLNKYVSTWNKYASKYYHVSSVKGKQKCEVTKFCLIKFDFFLLFHSTLYSYRLFTARNRHYILQQLVAPVFATNSMNFLNVCTHLFGIFLILALVLWYNQGLTPSAITHTASGWIKTLSWVLMIYSYLHAYCSDENMHFFGTA